MAKSLLFYVLVLLATSFFLLSRLLTVLNPTRHKPSRATRHDPHDPTHLLIVLGSGGHTAEMLAMLERAAAHPDPDSRLDMRQFRHRTWVVGQGDAISAQRAKEFEEEMVKSHCGDDGQENNCGSYTIAPVPRARSIHQSLLTTPLSCLSCLITSLGILTRFKGGMGNLDFPDLILCNGPATATILIFASILLRYLDWFGCHSRGKMRTIYVESWARVKSLSLSGKLLKGLVDRMLVQWPELERGRGRAEFMGILV